MFIKTFNFWDDKIFYFQITTEYSFSNKLNEKKMNFEFSSPIFIKSIYLFNIRIKNSKNNFFIFRGCKSFDHHEDILPPLNYSPSIFCNHFSSRELGRKRDAHSFLDFLRSFFFFLSLFLDTTSNRGRIIEARTKDSHDRKRSRRVRCCPEWTSTWTTPFTLFSGISHPPTDAPFLMSGN